jgi:hypothetical protein
MEFVNINKNFTLGQINCESKAAPAINNLQNIIVPNWANYLFLEIYSSSNSFPYQFLLNKNSASSFEVITPIKTLRNIWFFAIPINNRNLMLKVQRNEIRKYDSDDDYDYSYYKRVSIQTIRIAYGNNNSKGYSLINTSNGTLKEFSQSTYYTNIISIDSISVVCTKINTADFIEQLQISFGENKNKWLIINKGLTYYLKINGMLYTDFSQILLTTSNLQLIKNDGSLVNALPDTRYDSLEIKFSPYAQTEHVKTGDLIPNNSFANIGEVNNEYLRRGTLKVELLGRGVAWLDTGTHDSLLDASNFVHAIQNRQGQYVACIEEIAYVMGFIDSQQLIELAQPLVKSDYGKYLLRISEK